MTETGRLRVLIAEDEENLGQILKSFLAGRGHTVDAVTDGRAVLRNIREEPDSPEVIIITGNGTIETAITAMKLGAYDYMSKPYRMAEIDVLVRRAWEKRRLA